MFGGGKVIRDFKGRYKNVINKDSSKETVGRLKAFYMIANMK